MIPLKDDIPSETTPLVNYLLIFANFVVFFYELSLSPMALHHFVYTFGFVPAKFSWALVHGEPILSALLPVFTSMFLHGGWFHILGNMLFLYIFGDNVEDAMGHFGYFVFYIISGLVAALFQYIISPHSTSPMIGASGAIAGVLGAYFVLYPRARILTLVFFFIFVDVIYIPAFFFLFFWFAFQIINGSASLAMAGAGGVAWWAHIGGFVAGVGLVPLFRKKRGPAYEIFRPW